MTLSRRAWAAIAAAAGGGLAVFAVALHSVLASPAPTTKVILLALLFGGLAVASWLRPLIVYVENQSTSAHLDESILILLLLLVGPDLTVITFGLATIAAQLLMRRPLSKSAFNVGQLMISVAAAGAAFQALSPGGSHLGYRHLGAAVVGAVVFIVANKAAMTTILAATGGAWRQVLTAGLDFRLLLDGGGIVVALAAALLISADPWAVPVAVVPLILLRIVLAGRFEASHDRARLAGLFRAALEVHRSVGKDQVSTDILQSAQELLRCSAASLDGIEREDGELCAPVPLVDGTLWLSVSGRSRTEPFDAADRALLEALAAIGAGALSNATLYEQDRHQKERLAAITSSLGEGVLAIGHNGQITLMNPAATAMLGLESLERPELLELLAGLREGPPVPDFVLAPAMRAMTSGQTVSNYDTCFQRADGTPFDVAYTASPIIEAGGTSGAVVVFRDITERKRLEEQLARHAFHDALTGLPNRRLFLDHFDHALRRAQRSGQRHALLFADIDRFKLINDSLGHHAGDSLLVAIAERLQHVVRPGDMLARFGGDEFTLLLEGVGGTEEAVAVAERLLECLREPISLTDGHEIVARMSVGIALVTPDKSRDDLLRDADVAMYQAKARGRSGYYEVFDARAMGVRSAERVELEVALRQALERGELEVYYQPLFSLSSWQVVGAEALVRWNHPERGLLGPEQFIGLAEDTGLILPLGRTVLEQACEQANAWQERFGTGLSVAVNLSARQFEDAGLIDDVERVLATTGLDPSQLCLEITEGLAMEHVEQTNEVLAKLKGLGARVAIDDFGTGYSALGYLASFPIDVVKVDRSFVDGVEVDPVKSAIVSAVITMSKTIGSTIVVEGVETEAQLEHLRDLGCTVAQGFYLTQPVSAGQFEALLEAKDVLDAARRFGRRSHQVVVAQSA